jgi:hypothetical protein
LLPCCLPRCEFLTLLQACSNQVLRIASITACIKVLAA